MKEQITQPPGYRWFNGAILTEQQVAGYNRRSNEINRYLSGGYDAFQDRIEALMDERHLFLTTCFEQGGCHENR
jgi:hypothetical protein